VRPTSIALRFSVLYFTLYVLSTQMLFGLIWLPFEVPNLRELGMLPPLSWLSTWFAVHLFGANAATLQIASTGSGDKTIDFANVVTCLVLAAIGTVVWSLLDRTGERDAKVQAWFRLFLRFALGSTMLQYASFKVIPLQMPAPTLNRLLEPFGNMSPMGVLWASIGASSSYETFAGLAELTAAVLLFIPGITTLAAMVTFAVVTQVWVLNMTYDVPVKLFSLHLLLMSAVLLLPELKRLLQFFILNRPTGASTLAPLSPNPRRQRLLIVAQVIFTLYLMGVGTYDMLQAWKTRSAGANPPLFGIWTIDTMRIDGATRSPLVTDYDRWRRVLFSYAKRISFQRMDSTFILCTMELDTNGKTMALGKADDKAWKANFTYQQPSPDRLIMDGTMDKHAIHLDLRLEDHTKMLLLSRGFHWIQENPFNR
jgi:hypothetical protein